MKIQWDYSGRIYFNLHFKQRKNSLSVCDLFLFVAGDLWEKLFCYLREKGLFVCWKIGTLCVFKIVIDWSRRILLENWFLRLMGKLFSEVSLLGIRWRLEKEDIKGSTAQNSSNRIFSMLHKGVVHKLRNANFELPLVE